MVAKSENTHGLALKREPNYYDESEFHHVRQNPNLDALVDEGLVGKVMKHRRTSDYRIINRDIPKIGAWRAWGHNNRPGEVIAPVDKLRHGIPGSEPQLPSLKTPAHHY